MLSLRIAERLVLFFRTWTVLEVVESVCESHMMHALYVTVFSRCLFVIVLYCFVLTVFFLDYHSLPNMHIKPYMKRLVEEPGMSHFSEVEKTRFKGSPACNLCCKCHNFTTFCIHYICRYGHTAINFNFTNVTQM